MSGDGKVIAPVAVNMWWFWLGVAAIILVVMWVLFVLWVTRKKPEPTLATVRILPPKQVNVTEIKQRYLAILTDIEQSYQARAITARDAHQKISYAARCFVYEMTQKRTQTFTLADLDKTNLTALSDIIRGVYPSEFDKITHGDVADSVAHAKDMVTQW